MMLRAAIVITMMFMATACGFHLRDNLSLPAAMQSTYIDYAGGDADVLRTMSRALALNDVDVVLTPEAATATLNILSAHVDRRILLKDFTGAAREYEVAIVLNYSVTSAEGTSLVPEQEVRRRGYVVLDPETPNANAGEIANAVERLREDAVWEMLNRIAAAKIPVDGAADETTDNPGHSLQATQ